MLTCSDCGKSKPESEFYLRSGSKTRYHSYCKACHKKHSRKRNESKRGREYQRRYHESEHGKVTKRARNVKRKYGLTLDEVEDMAKAQNYSCLLCGSRGRRLVIDHNHDTGKVRGLLCVPCNAFLGYVETMGFKRIKAYLRGEL